MKTRIICPNCRSELEASGNLEVSAPSISILNCPVCGFPNWIPGGYPVPTRWAGLEVIKRNEPVTLFEDLKKESPELAKQFEQAPEEAGKGIYKDFSLLPSNLDLQSLGQGAYKIGLWVLVVLLLVYLIRRK
jgi:hypothetical protein